MSLRPHSILAHVDTLAPADGGDAVMRRASRLAASAGARLTIADVAPDVPAYVRRLLPGWERVSQVLHEERFERLHALARRARRLGVHPELLVLEGPTAVALTREARRAGHDLVLHATPDDGGGAVVARHLARRSPCPVLLLPGGAAAPASRRRRARVLAAVDVPDDDDGTRAAADAALTTRILAAAAELAELEGAELHVLHAWSVVGEGLLRRRALGGISQADVTRYVAGVQARAGDALRRAVAPLGERVAPERVHLVKGEPDAVIPAFARARAVDTLVIGTMARSGLAGLVVGNTAERVLDAAPCALLVVTPGAAPPASAAVPASEPAGVAASFR